MKNTVESLTIKAAQVHKDLENGKITPEALTIIRELCKKIHELEVLNKIFRENSSKRMNEVQTLIEQLEGNGLIPNIYVQYTKDGVISFE